MKYNQCIKLVINVQSRMFMCVCVCVCVCVYIHTHIYIIIYMCVCARVCVCVFIQLKLNECTLAGNQNNIRMLTCVQYRAATQPVTRS